MHKGRYIYVFVLIFYFGRILSQPPIDTADLSGYITKSLITWGNPGLAIALVDENGIVYTRGFGYTGLDKNKNIDQHTLFFTASITKGFTAAALTDILSEQQIDYDTRVKEIMPEFELSNPALNNRVTIEDLLTHQIGYKTFAGDLLWYGTTYSRKEIIERIKYVDLTYGYHQQFGYSNLMYLVAGQMIPVLTNSSWEEAIKNKFLTPLEMNSTVLQLRQALESDNIAFPAICNSNGECLQVQYIDWNNITPAGSVFTNVMDISNWIRMWLNDGNYNGKEILSKDQIDYLTKVEAKLELSNTEKIMMPYVSRKGYAKGWYVYKMNKTNVLEHSGGALGMVSQVTMVPDKNLGFAIFTNSNNYLPIALNNYILDRIFGKSNYDWSKIYFNSHFNYDEYIQTQKEHFLDSLKNLPSESLHPKDIVGTYNSTMYGDVEIKYENDSLFCLFKPSYIYKAVLKPVNRNIYQIKMMNDPSLDVGLVEFILNGENIVTRMKIDIPNPDFDFTELKLYKTDNHGM